jgi:hypothetical protein
MEILGNGCEKGGFLEINQSGILGNTKSYEISFAQIRGY